MLKPEAGGGFLGFFDFFFHNAFEIPVLSGKPGGW